LPGAPFVEAAGEQWIVIGENRRGKQAGIGRPGFADCQSPDRHAGAGICAIDNRLSRPARLFDSTGTPRIGSRVIDAAIPGRCAAPPAPAMISFRPRLTAVLA
jgi:hypothetical protein